MYRRDGSLSILIQDMDSQTIECMNVDSASPYRSRLRTVTHVCLKRFLGSRTLLNLPDAIAIAVPVRGCGRHFDQAVLEGEDD